VVLPAPATRPAIGTAITLTLGSALVAPFIQLQRPPIWTIMSLLGLGCIAFVGARRPTAETRLNIAGAATAVVMGCKLISPGVTGYYQPVIARIGTVAAIGVLATAVVALHRHRRLHREAERRGRSVQQVLMAGLLLAMPATWLGPIDSIAWQFPVDNLTAARFGRLAHVILASCMVLCLLALMRPNHPLRTSVVSSVVGGGALGYGCFAAVVGREPHAAVTLGAMLIVLLTLGTRPRALMTISTAGLMGLACWLVGVYSNDWSATDWTNPSRTVVLASMLTMVPCSLAIVAGIRNRSIAALPAGMWIGYLTLPALAAWGPLLWALAAAALIGLARKVFTGSPATGR
jgi:hypothetical protein